MFSVDEAFEASEAGEPVTLNHLALEGILEQHDAIPSEYYADHPEDETGDIDAAKVFGWLGY